MKSERIQEIKKVKKPYKKTKKRIIITKLREINNKKIANFINSSEGTIVYWKKENSEKKEMLLSAVVGYYLFGEPSPVFNELKNNFLSLKEKVSKHKQCFKDISKELEFMSYFFKDIENIQETIFKK
jgi:hypothetical protein